MSISYSWQLLFAAFKCDIKSRFSVIRRAKLVPQLWLVFSCSFKTVVCLTLGTHFLSCCCKKQLIASANTPRSHLLPPCKHTCAEQTANSKIFLGFRSRLMVAFVALPPLLTGASSGGAVGRNLSTTSLNMQQVGLWLARAVNKPQPQMESSQTNKQNNNSKQSC